MKGKNKQKSFLEPEQTPRKIGTFNFSNSSSEITSEEFSADREILQPFAKRGQDKLSFRQSNGKALESRVRNPLEQQAVLEGLHQSQNQFSLLQSTNISSGSLAQTPPMTAEGTSVWHPSSDSSWELVFSDEFNGTELDLNNWNTTYWWGGRTNYGNNESQYYVDDAFEFEDGILKIVAKEETIQAFEPVDGNQVFDYTSGLLSGHDKRAFSNGYMEIRAKVPAGQGLWPAFWMLPSSKTWPPEIDILEFQGHQTDTLHGTHHYPDPSQPSGRGLQGGSYSPGIDFSEDFHTYAAEWNTSEIIWYVDGIEIIRVDNYIPNEPMYLLANLAVGGNWPGQPDETTPFPSSFDIDYIRVYQNEQGTLHGGIGNDILSRANGNLSGEDGADVLTLSGMGSLYGGNGNDTLTGGSGNNFLYGNDGNDQLHGGAGLDSLYGGTGGDTLSGGEGNDVLDGKAGEDTLAGEAGADYLYGGDGNDQLAGGEGADNLFGGEGDDTLSGGVDNDVLDGKSGSDNLLGGTGEDSLYGGEGNDVLSGEAGNDTLFGGNGDDSLSGDDGSDFLTGKAGDDTLLGGDGNDYIAGEEGNDVLFGGSGNDELYGGNDSDTLTGTGGSGNGVGTIDRLTGGGGSDLFVLGESGMAFYDDGNQSSSGAEDFAILTDFDKSVDRIQLAGSANQYILGASPINGASDTAIYLDSNGNGSLTSVDELIGVVESSSNISLSDSYFIYV